MIILETKSEQWYKKRVWVVISKQPQRRTIEMIKNVKINGELPYRVTVDFFGEYWWPNSQANNNVIIISGYTDDGDGCWWRLRPLKSRTANIFFHWRRSTAFQRCHQHRNSVANIQKFSPTSSDQHELVINIYMALVISLGCCCPTLTWRDPQNRHQHFNIVTKTSSTSVTNIG